MTRYVALLRGINVGNRRIKMAGLRDAFTAWDYAPVKTFLAAGNVLFTAPDGADPAALTATLEDNLSDHYGYDIPVILRTHQHIQDLVASAPFAGVTVTPDTRLYVSFLTATPTGSVTLPDTAPGDDFHILAVRGADIFSVLTLNRDSRTVDAMQVLEQTFGSRITTRNWNTVVKIGAG